MFLRLCVYKCVGVDVESPGVCLESLNSIGVVAEGSLGSSPEGRVKFRVEGETTSIGTLSSSL